MAQINLNITLDITDDHGDKIDNLREVLGARLEYIIGEEFGDPTITHRDDVNWAGELYIDETTNPTVRDITID